MVHRVKQVSIVVLSMLVLLSTLIVGTYAKATNLVSNGDFSQGTNYWSMNQSDGSLAMMSSDNHSLKVQIEKVNSDDYWWSLTLKQDNIALSANKKYQLSFDVEASMSGDISLDIESTSDYNKKYLDRQMIAISNQKKTYTFDFEKKDDDAVTLVYHLAKGDGISDFSNQIIKLSNVTIIEIGDIEIQKAGDWYLNEGDGANGKLSGEPNDLKVKVTSINQENYWWALSLKKENLVLSGNKIYKIVFDAKASKAGTIGIDIEKSADYNVKYLDKQNFDLTTTSKEYSFNFIKKDNDDVSIVFLLNEGDGISNFKDETINIRNVRIEEVNDLGDEYVVNGDFETNTTSGWNTYNSNGSNLKINAVNQQLEVTFPNSNGSNYWDCQLFQGDILLDNGIYRLSYDLKGSKAGTIYFDVEDTGDYATKYYPETMVDFTKDVQTYNFEFEINADNLLGTQKNAKIQFNLGPNEHCDSLAGETLYFDNIKIEKIGSGAGTGELQTTNVTFDGNDVLVNNFKGLGVQWDPYVVHPLTDEEWQTVTKRVDFLNPAFVRCMIYANTYCEGFDDEGNPIYDFDSLANQALIRELDYLESRDIEVVLGEWETPDRFGGEFEGITVDDPRWASIIGGFLDYLINQKGYTCIKYFNYVNEANSDWSYCGDFDKWQTGINYLHTELDKYGLNEKIKITGPDTVWDSDNTWLKEINSNQDLGAKIGLYDTHMYPTIDEITNGTIEEMVAEQRSCVTGKDFYMTEIGMVTGKSDGDSQPYTKEFSYGVIMADAASQVMRGGFSGLAIWDLDDAMHDQQNGFPITDIRSLKQWGFWNSVAGRVFNQPEEEEIRPFFYTWSLMANLFPRNSKIIGSTANKELNGLRTVGMEKDGQMTYMIVNDSNSPKEVTIDVKNLNANNLKLFKYDYFDNDRKVDSNGYPVASKVLENVNLEEGYEVSLPSGGVVMLSTIDIEDAKKELVDQNDSKQDNENKNEVAIKTGDDLKTAGFMISGLLATAFIYGMKKKG